MTIYTITDPSHLTNENSIQSLINCDQAYGVNINVDFDLIKALNDGISLEYKGLKSVYVGSLLNLRNLEMKSVLPVQTKRIAVIKFTDIKEKSIEKLARLNFAHSVDDNQFIHNISSDILYIYENVSGDYTLLLDDQDAVMGKLDAEY